MATAARQYDEPDEKPEDEAEGKASPSKWPEIHERAKKRFDDSSEFQLELRAHALLCRRFISIPGAMWEGPWGE